MADGTPRNLLLRKRDPAQAAARILRSLFWHKLGFGFAALFAVLVAGFCLLLAATSYPWTTALYLTMRAASLASSIALVSVTSSDEVNLEAALHARALRSDLRIVLRLYDDDLAERVQKMIGNTVSRSVSYLAAPAFAAAMLEHQGLRTIPVGRHVLLIADIQVEPDAELVGQPVEAAQQPGEVHVLAVRRRGRDSFDWSLAASYRIAPQDRLLVLATRAGRGQTLARNQHRPTLDTPRKTTAPGYREPGAGSVTLSADLLPGSAEPGGICMAAR